MAAVDAFGTVWAISTDGGSTYDAVADVTEIGVLDVKVETIDTTVHGTDQQYRTFITGMKDGGELRMAVNYDPANHADIWSAIGNDSLRHELTLTDEGEATVEFNGLITGISMAAPVDDKLSAEVTLKVSGPPVITP